LAVARASGELGAEPVGLAGGRFHEREDYPRIGTNWQQNI
jgi:hypothetical protein